MDATKTYYHDDLIPTAMFAKDHWSTLAYIESVMTECAGFQVGLDPRMRSSRRNHRIMSEECGRPKRPAGVVGREPASMAQPMRLEHSTRLKGGAVVSGHDDWSCLQDMAAEGYFTVRQDEIEPGVVLHLSERGRIVAAALRTFNAAGGQFVDFVPPEVSAVAEPA